MKKFSSELGTLADSKSFREPITIGNGRSKDELVDMLNTMLIIRQVELEIASWIEEGIAKCPCHLGVGQEAVATGIAQELRKTDRVFGTHRSHPHFLAMGGSVRELFAEVLGKATGCASGIGGSMHLLDKKNGFYGSVPIVGGTIPIAVGSALAAKMDNKGDIAVCFFGDGAAEEGVLHESMNLASSHALPVLFVCENNLYSSHLDIKLRQPSDRIARFADAHHLPNKVIDGNDILLVKEATSDLISSMRKGENAAFLEVVTYRWRGHVGANEDIDVGVRRKKEDLISWKMRDPIERLAKGMIQQNMLDNAGYDEIVSKVVNFVKEEKNLAQQDPYPDSSSLLNHVYAESLTN